MQTACPPCWQRARPSEAQEIAVPAREEFRTTSESPVGVADSAGRPERVRSRVPVPGARDPQRKPRHVVDLREGAQGTELQPYLTGRMLTAPAEVLAAKVLHARVYVARGWVPEGAVGADGTFGVEADPWSSSADWFGSVRGGEVYAAARTLAARELDRLPSLRLAGIPALERRVLSEMRADAVVEISALARAADAAPSDVPAVIAAMWRESLRRGHEAWLMAVDVAVFEMLRRRVVGAAIRAIGPRQPYLGSDVVPAVIRFEDLAPAQLELGRRHRGPDPLPALLPRLFPAAPVVRR